MKKVKNLLKEIARDPFNGLVKPEPLKFQLSGYWSRRISGELRLVYQIVHQDVVVITCRYQYE